MPGGPDYIVFGQWVGGCEKPLCDCAGTVQVPNAVNVPLDQRLANSVTNCWTGDTVQPLEELESVLSLYSINQGG